MKHTELCVLAMNIGGQRPLEAIFEEEKKWKFLGISENYQTNSQNCCIETSHIDALKKRWVWMRCAAKLLKTNMKLGAIALRRYLQHSGFYSIMYKICFVYRYKQIYHISAYDGVQCWKLFVFKWEVSDEWGTFPPPCLSLTCHVNIQGAPKKMYHSYLYLISVLEVGLYFFTCVIDSEFRARFIGTLKQGPFWI